MALALCTISPQTATLWPALLCCFLLLLTSRAAGGDLSLTWSWEQEAQTFMRRLMAISSCPDPGEQAELGREDGLPNLRGTHGMTRRFELHSKHEHALPVIAATGSP